MQEIRFRGRINGEWVFGGLIQWNGMYAIIKHIHSINNIWKTEKIKVEANSVGQLVCCDKNKNLVWSNSKVKYFGKVYGLVYMTNGWYIDDISYPNFEEKDIEVVVD